MDGFEGFERIEERLRLAAIQFLPALELSSNNEDTLVRALIWGSCCRE
jgi:hypothetical protein